MRVSGVDETHTGVVIGTSSLVAAARRSATVMAIEPTVTWTLSRAQLAKARADNLAVDALLIDLLANQVHRLTTQLVEALYVPVRHRVVRALLDLSVQSGSPVTGGGLGTVTLHITQDDVAGLTGAARPTVNQVLRTLEEVGAIRLHRGRIDIVDQALLAQHRG